MGTGGWVKRLGYVGSIAQQQSVTCTVHKLGDERNSLEGFYLKKHPNDHAAATPFPIHPYFFGCNTKNTGKIPFRRSYQAAALCFPPPFPTHPTTTATQRRLVPSAARQVSWQWCLACGRGTGVDSSSTECVKPGWIYRERVAGRGRKFGWVGWWCCVCFLLIDGGYVLSVIICTVMLYLIIDMYINIYLYILCIYLLMFWCIVSIIQVHIYFQDKHEPTIKNWNDIYLLQSEFFNGWNHVRFLVDVFPFPRSHVQVPD